MSSTDTADEIQVHVNPPKKRLKKNHLSVQMKEYILNIYKYELEEHPDTVNEEILERVAKKVGVCRSSVYNVIKEYKESHSFSKPKTNQNRKTLIDRLDKMEKQIIRRKIHDFFFRNEIPTLDKILRVVNDDPDLPNLSRSTLYTLIKHLKFIYKKHGRNSILIDGPEIVRWRRDYLIAIKAYRKESRKIYYLGDTWVNADHTRAFLDGLSTELKHPAGKGKRLTVCHIGSVDGFVNDGLWCFQSKTTGDYHEEINEESFEQWFSKILPLLDDNSIVVLHNASYDSRKLEKVPTSTSSKADIQNWLRLKNIEFDEEMLKYQLLDIVKQHKSQYNKYVVDEMAKAHNITVLRLPPYHCDLNPIELIWADAKDFVAKHNATCKLPDVKDLFNRALVNITPAEWQNCIEHVVKEVESKMWTIDNIMEMQEKNIINVNENDDESSSLSE